MSQAAEKFVALNQETGWTAIRAFQIGFNAWEMLIKLNLEATRMLLPGGHGKRPGDAKAAEVAGLSGVERTIPPGRTDCRATSETL